MTTTRLLYLLVAILAFSPWLAAQADYPERRVMAIIPWGKGGATDNLMRTLTPLAERALGQPIALRNWRGKTAVNGSQHVLKQRADGYTLLLGAENAQLYTLLGLADFDYSAFYPVNIIGQNTALIVVRGDSPWHSMGELLAAADARPGTLRMGATGTGGLPNTVRAMIQAVHDLQVEPVTFGGDGPGIAALARGQIDFMPMTLAAARKLLATGEVRAVAVVAKEPIAELPHVAPITETLPGMAEYLPWGPFYGVWVHRDTPDAIKQRLTRVYADAVASDEMQTFLHNAGIRSLNISGHEAEAYLTRWQSVTAWSMYRAKSVSISPATLGIAPP
jgi:tripartite-type tricarboxylate transporter receptor subunit TctC